jgi:hypothetical protein
VLTISTIIILCLFIVRALHLLTFKYDLKKAGINYFKIKEERGKSIKIFLLILCALCIILFIGGIFFLIVNEWIMALFCLIFPLWYIFELISNKKYGNIYGIYENGIISFPKEFYKWNNIYTYEIYENNIFVNCKNDTKIEIKNIENIDEIEKLFEKNNIMKRN